MITYTTAATDVELQQILALQQRNLAKHLTSEQALTQGFLTVEHDFAILKKMNDFENAILAKDGDQLAGYLLAMTKDLRADIPILLSMFEVLDEVVYQGKRLESVRYIVVGQACVAEAYRGQGVFDGCYAAYRQFLQPKYDCAVTEISRRNTRSLRAHRRVGFQVIQEYVAPEGEVWDIVLWDWQNK